MPKQSKLQMPYKAPKEYHVSNKTMKRHRSDMIFESQEFKQAVKREAKKDKY